MIREPLLPILKNLENMRAVARCLDSLDYEAGRLAAKVLADTTGGRELPEFQLSSSEFMGVRLPYGEDLQGQDRSCGDWPPATDDARPGPLYLKKSPRPALRRNLCQGIESQLGGRSRGSRLGCERTCGRRITLPQHRQDRSGVRWSGARWLTSTARNCLKIYPWIRTSTRTSTVTTWATSSATSARN